MSVSLWEVRRCGCVQSRLCWFAQRSDYSSASTACHAVHIAIGPPRDTVQRLPP